MIMKQLKLMAFTAMLLVGAIACQKEEAEVTLTSDQIDQEVLAETLLAEIDELTDEGIDFQLGILKSGSDAGMYLDDACPVITYDKEANPRKIVFDYGTGCEGKDGKMRSGKIIITSTAFENLSFERVKSFENFVVEGKKMEGSITKKIKFNRDEFTRVAEIKEDVTIIFEDANTLTRKANLTREHAFGIPGVRADDESSTWGTAVTKRATGITITKTIEEATPLVFKNMCRQIVSGIVTFSNGDSTWSINYGNGECDNTATVTRNGETRTVKLRK